MYMYKIYDVHAVICMHVVLPGRKNREKIAWHKKEKKISFDFFGIN